MSNKHDFSKELIGGPERSTPSVGAHIGLLAETVAGETRVALTPDDVRRLSKLVRVSIERGAGARAGFDDRAYEAAGGQLVGRDDVLTAASLVVSVRPLADVSRLARGTAVVSLGGRDPAVIERMRAQGLRHLGLERVPRTARAQSMDVLTSQATVAGYAAVLEGARHLRVMLPMTSTAAGIIKPAKMIAVGTGVAGLQAIATARRLGAVVHGFDVRAASREQVESLGAKFLSPLSLQAASEAPGGYAREADADQQEAVRRSLAEYLRPMQLIVTSALVPGRRAPVLIDDAAVATLSDGAVIVDLAAETGGNCTLTRADEVVRAHGVTIVGPTNLAGTLAADASRLFGGNVRAVIEHVLAEDGTLALETGDPILAALLGRDLAPPPPAAMPTINTSAEVAS